jgi:hypothetical protein
LLQYRLIIATRSLDRTLVALEITRSGSKARAGRTFFVPELLGLAIS